MHMNNERTQAYGRVVKTLDELGPTKLQPAEQDRVREAADTLIFAADLDEARAAMADIDSLAEHLVASDRWSEERARQLVDDLRAGGPVTAVG
jgi:superfamily II DNA or RNA helicase